LTDSAVFMLVWKVLFILVALIVVYGSRQNKAASNIILNDCPIHYSSFEN